VRVLIVGEGVHEETALPTIVDRLAGPGLIFDFLPVRNVNIRIHGKGGGMKKKAVAAMIQAEKSGYNAVVFLVDEDGDPGRQRQIDQAQHDSTSIIRRAVRLAIRRFDAWMLADERALTLVLHCMVDRPPVPAAIKDPKRHCAELLANSGRQMAQREMYFELAKCFDLEKLSACCPQGFAPFAERVKSLFLARAS
jgi:hypothetical protein